MKRVSNAAEPVVPIPPVVVAVHVHVALIIPAVERGESYSEPSMPLPFEYSQGCIVFRIEMR